MTQVEIARRAAQTKAAAAKAAEKLPSWRNNFNEGDARPSANEDVLAPEHSRAANRARGPPLSRELELRRILSLSQVSELTSLSEDSLKRNHADKIRKLGPRRLGMTLGDALSIGST
jgi:hypothetical protein